MKKEEKHRGRDKVLKTHSPVLVAPLIIKLRKLPMNSLRQQIEQQHQDTQLHEFLLSDESSRVGQILVLCWSTKIAAAEVDLDKRASPL